MANYKEIKKNKKKYRDCLSQCWGPQLTTSRWSVDAWWVKRPLFLTFQNVRLREVTGTALPKLCSSRTKTSNISTYIPTLCPLIVFKCLLMFKNGWIAPHYFLMAFSLWGKTIRYQIFNPHKHHDFPSMLD